MIRIVVDDELRAKLSGHGDSDVELCDRTGLLLGRFVPADTRSAYRNWNCPVSDKELDRRSREESGRPLADILRDLKAHP